MVLERYKNAEFTGGGKKKENLTRLLQRAEKGEMREYQGAKKKEESTVTSKMRGGCNSTKNLQPG